MKFNYKKTLLLTGIVALISFNGMDAQTICSNDQGSHGGYTYEYWKDNGNGCMTLGQGGTYSVEWSNIGNLLARKGLRPGGRNVVINYGANYQPSGNSYLCVYGWTTNPLVEFYIVESWGSWRPPGASSKGTVTTDGGTYEIYETTRTQQPSIEGTRTFQQYWSVRTSKRTSGTITCANHFAAWERAGMNLGNFYEVSFCVEGYQSSGTADVYSMSMSTDGTGGDTGGDTGGGTSDQGDGEYTLTVRARGMAGGEHLNVLIDNQVQAGINLSTSWQEYEVYVDRGDLNLEFDNDGGDRDVQVDWIEIHGETRQAEDMEYNTAVYQDGSCGGSYSEMMHCGGVIGFGDITYQGDSGDSSGGDTSSDNNTIVVRGRGTAGGENLRVTVGGIEVANYSLNTSFTNETIYTSATGGINVEFTNDGGDRDVQVDYIEVNGAIWQAEDQSTNTGVWQDGSCGGSYSEWMHCGGYIGFNPLRSASGTASQIATADETDETSVSIFPNPVVNVLNLSVSAKSDGLFEAVIYNTNGAAVKQFLAQPGNNPVSLSDLPNGIYFLLISVDNQTFNLKFLK